MRYVPYYDIKQTYSVAREIKLSEFANIVGAYISASRETMFGIISLNPDAIYEFGVLEDITLDEANIVFKFQHMQTGELQEVTFDNEKITATYDVKLTIVDEKKGNIGYPIYYITIAEDKEVTYYIAAKHFVSRPLDCIAEFYIRANDFRGDIKRDEPAFCRIDKKER